MIGEYENKFCGVVVSVFFFHFFVNYYFSICTRDQGLILMHDLIDEHDSLCFPWYCTIAYDTISYYTIT